MRFTRFMCKKPLGPSNGLSPRAQIRNFFCHHSIRHSIISQMKQYLAKSYEIYSIYVQKILRAEQRPQSKGPNLKLFSAHSFRYSITFHKKLNLAKSDEIYLIYVQKTLRAEQRPQSKGPNLNLFSPRSLRYSITFRKKTKSSKIG